MVLFLFILSLKFSPTYIYRLITQNVADVYGYQLYENRTIKAANRTFQFAESPNVENIETLFQEMMLNYGRLPKKQKKKNIIYINRTL